MSRHAPRVAAGTDASGDDLQADEVSLVRLVLDGVLEVETAPGTSSLAAALTAWSATFFHHRCRGRRQPVCPRQRCDSTRARHEDVLRLSARLYFYGRLPASPDWLARLSSRAAIDGSSKWIRRDASTQAPPFVASSRARASERRLVPLAHRDGPDGRSTVSVQALRQPTPESVPAAFAAASTSRGRSAP